MAAIENDIAKTDAGKDKEKRQGFQLVELL
jgi:hypothetical protein